ncbi:hypothetical protein [Saccharopolyspora shandongensis]|uniref:hypothetical protein n=1 Tax=Saccharopolyspora shandongensis TaxID=418495 RepID=UPI0033CD0830
MAYDKTSKRTPGCPGACNAGTVPISDRRFARLVRMDPHKSERGARGGHCRTIGCPERAWWTSHHDTQLYGSQGRQYRCFACADFVERRRFAGSDPDEQQIVSARGITPPEVDPTTELAEIRTLLGVCDVMARLTGICGERGPNNAAEALFEEIDEAESEITQRVRELDEWISSGGQLPQQWRPVQPGDGR